MADSESPKHRKISLYPALLALKDYTKTMITAIVAAGSALLTVQRWIDSYATDAEVSAEVHAHNKDEHAHQAMVDKIIRQVEIATEQGRVLEAIEQKRRDDHQALYQLYWWRVGEKAAEACRDPRKRDRARADAQDRFDGFLGRGMGLDEAYARVVGAGVP